MEGNGFGATCFAACLRTGCVEIGVSESESRSSMMLTPAGARELAALEGSFAGWMPSLLFEEPTRLAVLLLLLIGAPRFDVGFFPLDLEMGR